MNARFALYLIVLIALLSSVSLILFVKFFSYKQQMIIQQPSEQKSASILHPPSNLKKDAGNGEKNPTTNIGPKIHDTTNKDTNVVEQQENQQQSSLTDSFNVQKIQVSKQKKNHQTAIIDGYFDDRIDILDTKNALNQLGENLDPKESLKINIENAQCRNTKQGAEYITDSLGYVCSIMHVDPKTKCCKHVDDEQARKDGLPPVERYSCSTCHTTNQCCSSFEHCVSCCMDIDKREDLQRSFQQWKDDKLFKGVKTVFELCLLRCRTTSKSVQNETRYKDSRYRYCYGSIN